MSNEINESLKTHIINSYSSTHQNVNTPSNKGQTMSLISTTRPNTLSLLTICDTDLLTGQAENITIVPTTNSIKVRCSIYNIYQYNEIDQTSC